MLSTVEMREMTDDELNEELQSIQAERARLRYRAAVEELENPSETRDLRRQVARLKTILNEKAAGKRASGESEIG